MAAQIKNIIETLCNILNKYGFSELTAEDFRLAKYNKPQAIKKMWILLYELICYNRSEVITNEQKDFITKLSPETIITSIKTELMRKGYYCDDFLQIKHDFDTSENTSSREVLLAAGWFIANQKIFEKFICNTDSAFDYECAKDAALEKIDITELVNENNEIMAEYEKNESNVKNQLNFHKWLNGRIKFKINSLYSCLNEKSKLLHQIHKYTEDCGPYGFNHLSAFELSLIKNPQKIAKYEVLLQKNSDLLTSLMNWVENENIFWKWMESVLDEKLKENQPQKVDYDDDPLYKSLVMTISAHEIDKLKASKKNFDNEKSKLDTLRANTQTIKDEIIDEAFLNKFIDQIQEFDNKIQNEFTAIMNTSTIPTKSNKRFGGIDEKFNFNLPTLNLLKKSRDTNYQTISSKISIIEKELEKFNSNLKNTQSRTLQKCESFAENLQDCLIVTNK